jgi:hypothetical protein
LRERQEELCRQQPEAPAITVTAADTLTPIIQELQEKLPDGLILLIRLAYAKPEERELIIEDWQYSKPRPRKPKTTLSFLRENVVLVKDDAVASDVMGWLEANITEPGPALTEIQKFKRFEALKARQAELRAQVRAATGTDDEPENELTDTRTFN